MLSRRQSADAQGEVFISYSPAQRVCFGAKKVTQGVKGESPLKAVTEFRQGDVFAGRGEGKFLFIRGPLGGITLEELPELGEGLEGAQPV